MHNWTQNADSLTLERALPAILYRTPGVNFKLAGHKFKMKAVCHGMAIALKSEA